MINGKIITTIPVVKQQATLYFLEKGTNQFELSLADDNGVLRTLYSGAGGASTTVPTLSQVLTAGNELNNKQIKGDLWVVNDEITAAGNKDLEFRIRDNHLEFFSKELSHKEQLDFVASLSDLRYGSYTENGDRFSLSLSSSGYSIDIPDTKSGIQGKNLNLNFTSDSGLYSSEIFSITEDGQFIQKKYLDDRLAGLSTGGGGGTATPQTLSQVLTAGNNLDGKEIVGDLVVKSDDRTGGTSNLSFVGSEGLSSSKYHEPTRDEQYVQKKYVDSLLGGGKIDVTVDRMYLTYAGKLAVDITINGLSEVKMQDPNLLEYSTFRMKVATLTGSIQAHFTFGPTGNATIKKTYEYRYTGTVKAHIEAVLPPLAVDKWGEPSPSKDVFNQTQGFFMYIPEAGMPFNEGVRSRMTSYGEVYDKRQSGVVNFKLQDGKQSTLIPSTEEYKFFAFDADTFKAEDPVDSKYSYFINNGIPIGSQDVQSGYILSDNRIMPNPTPNQVTEWDLTFKVSGENASVLVGGFAHRAVVYDAENNLIDEVYIDAYSNSNNEVTSVRAKLTTINKFKNIVGDKRGFKFGIRINSESADSDIKFELVNIKRTSRALV